MITSLAKFVTKFMVKSTHGCIYVHGCIYARDYGCIWRDFFISLFS